MIDNKFDLKNYKNILITGLKLGFSFQTFSDYLDYPKNKTCLIRHDVDLSLKWAMQMAMLEKELGIKSTYFVRVHSTKYNLFDRFNYNHLHSLREMGFEIGVHQEVCNFAKSKDEAICLLMREKYVIETILGCQVNGVATHVPKSNMIKITDDVLQVTGFRYNPGQQIFNQDAIFVSDSNNHWKKYSLLEAMMSSKKVLANIHPVWWVKQPKRPDTIIKFIKEGN